MTQIHGHCEPGFERVRDVFAAQLAVPGELGAAVAIQREGRMVVDLWGGSADGARTRPWERDTLVNIFSTTKSLAALCIHRLADRGELELDAPVAKIWPEFGAAGKDRITVRHCLNHSAGMAAIRRPLATKSMYDWDTLTSALAEQEPWWEPGTRHGYHAVTFGWLTGEIVRRVSGKTIGRFLHDEIAGPLGADVRIGTGPEHDARIAELVPAPPPTDGTADVLAELLKNPTGLLAKAFLNPLLVPTVVNTPEWRRAEIPAANGHATARGLAQVFGAVAAPKRAPIPVLAPEGVKRSGVEEKAGPDLILLEMFTRYGPGFMLGTPDEPLGPNAGAFGHSGAGGSLAFADPTAALGFGYTMNKMHTGMYLIGPRANGLIAATYQCV